MERQSRPRAYLAGPTVFFPDPLQFAKKLQALCSSNGLVGVFPLEEIASSPTASAVEIFQHNVEQLRNCDLVVADISPFRGPHADDGTAFEMGLAYALGKPIFSYSNDVRPMRERIDSVRSSDSRLRDKDGLEVEEFGLIQNLMLCCGSISVHRDPASAIAAAARHFAQK